MKQPDAAAVAEKQLLQTALRYPDAHEDHPWGETVVKVKGKVFVFLGASDGRLGVTTKLPRTGPAALGLPFTEPCGYGLGKSGWVTARFDAGEDIPVDLLVSWLDESYRAVAPKRSVAALDGASTRTAPAAKKKAPAAKKKAPAAKKKAPAAKKKAPAAKKKAAAPAAKKKARVAKKKKVTGRRA